MGLALAEFGDAGTNLPSSSIFGPKPRIVAETDITEQDSVFAKRTNQWGEMEFTPGMLQGTGGLWWPERNNP
jgi:hypothetical protein